ncbi:MAG: hypothetical protein M0P71_00885 [Melioribacteraceae bacterium]|nr:hypothetical protein [Melioribacteraceae bacterium]
MNKKKNNPNYIKKTRSSRRKTGTPKLQPMSWEYWRILDGIYINGSRETRRLLSGKNGIVVK